MDPVRMSDISVNDHLEGILSDFEALKRSFEIDDADDIPAFSSPFPSPISPSSALLLNKSKTTEGFQSPSLQSTNHHTSHRSHLSLGSSSPCLVQGPTLRSRLAGGSLSFNHGTKPTMSHGNGSLTRAASFQSRFNHNGFLSSVVSVPGSDNDSLHSSSSSLEYSLHSGGVAGPPAARRGPYSPTPQLEGYKPQPWQALSPTINTFTSAAGCNSELEEVLPGLLLCESTEPFNHSSMPSLDLQISHGSKEGSRPPRVGEMSPGLCYKSSEDCNGRIHNKRSQKPKDSYYSPQNHLQARSKAKEAPPRLNKFPLDLDSLVGNGNNNRLQPSPSPNPPRHTSRTSAHSTPLTGGSTSSLESTSPTSHPLSSTSHPFSPSSHHYGCDEDLQDLFHNLCPPSSTGGSVPVPRVDCSPVFLSSDQNPQLDLLSMSQVISVATPNLAKGHPKPANGHPDPNPAKSQHPSRPTAQTMVDQSPGDERESVGSILQRIASFSRPTPGSLELTNGVQPQPRRLPLLGKQQHLPGAMAAPTTIQREGEDTVSGLERDTAMENSVTEEIGEMPIQEEKESLDKMHVESNADICIEKQTEVMQEKRGMEDMPEAAAPRTEFPPVPIGYVGKEERGMEEVTEASAPRIESLPTPSGYVGREERRMEYMPEAGAPRIECPESLPIPFGYVGIEAVLDQMRSKTMKAGFEFNVMVVGQSGLGKSTLVNTLFKSKVSRKSCTPNYEEKISKTVRLQSVSHVIEEKGVKMKLTVVDTPGFGDQINNEQCWEPIVKYVNEQYENYLKEELRVNRKRRIPDTRIHCCVYFLPATGHWLRPIDVEFMKRLGSIVSIVPVIAKADTLTIDERLEFKQRIRQDLQAYGIRVYPQRDNDEDSDDRIVNDRIRESIPFAVVGTDKEHQVNGNKVLGRKTKWGIIEVENVAHCEFTNLRDLLIRSHLQDLKDVTHNIHYETYRVLRLNESNMNVNGLALSCLRLENGTSDKSDSESHL